MSTVNFGNWLAALLTGLLLMGLLIKWGNGMRKSEKLDDFLRLFLAVFGIAGPLYVTPRFHGWALNIRDFFSSGAHGVTVDPVVITIIAAAFFAVFAYLFFQKSTWGRLALVVLVTLPLFSNDAMFTVANWWINHPASALFRGIISFFNAVAGYGWHL